MKPRSEIHRRDFIRTTAVGVGGLGLITWPAATGIAASERHAAANGLVAFRVGTEQWMPNDRFAALLDFFDKCPGTADEIAFFTSGTHPPLPLDEIRRRAALLAERMPRVRERGMAAGINLLSTMGHHEENLEGSLDEPWQRVMDPQGAVSRGSYCPASDGLLDYVDKVYTALAETSPDFLWIDDDVRLMGHMPIGSTCFCPACVQRFSQQTGRPFTRETLVAAFDTGTRDERLALRKQWLDHNRAAINHLFEVIERAVHKAKPGLTLGFMTGDRFYEGYDFAAWAKTLAGPAKSEVRWRPGGGFYSDESLTGLVGKAHDVGRQVSQLPPEVRVIQSEIENFPYDRLRKSVEATVIEAAAHMAAGTTGTAFNVLSQRPDPLDEYEMMLRRIAQMKPFYQALRDELGRHPLAGVWPAWNKDIFAANSLGGAWPQGGSDAIGNMQRAYVLGEIGIPVCYGPQKSVVTALCGPSLFTFSRDELQKIFSGGVLMDVAAWHFLDQLGLSGWTGVKSGPERPRDAIEVLSDHPLNGRYAGWSRDCRQSFWHETAQALEPTSPSVETLARMIDYVGHDLGISMTAFTNELGGRVAVMGYFPWSMMHHLGKSSQMKSVCAWLSNSRLPAWMDSFARTHLWVREPSPDRLACVLLNASLDPVAEPVLNLARKYSEYRWTTMDGNSQTLDPSTAADSQTPRVRLPAIRPWSVSLLTAKG